MEDYSDLGFRPAEADYSDLGFRATTPRSAQQKHSTPQDYEDLGFKPVGDIAAPKPPAQKLHVSFDRMPSAAPTPFVAGPEVRGTVPTGRPTPAVTIPDTLTPGKGLPGVAAPTIEPEEVATPTNVVTEGASGVRRGFLGVFKSLGDLASRMSGSDDRLAALSSQLHGIPIEQAKKQNRELGQQIFDQVAPVTRPSTAHTFGEALGSVGGFMAAAPAGVAATAGVGAGLGAEEALERSEQSGKTLTPSQKAEVVAGGIALGLTDAIPFEGLFSRVAKLGGKLAEHAGEESLKKALYPEILDYAKTSAAQMLEEGGQEALQSAGQDALEVSYGARKPEDIGQTALGEFAAGGGVGALMGLMGHAVGTRAGRARLKAAGFDPDVVSAALKEEAAQQKSPQEPTTETPTEVPTAESPARIRRERVKRSTMEAPATLNDLGFKPTSNEQPKEGVSAESPAPPSEEVIPQPEVSTERAGEAMTPEIVSETAENKGNQRPVKPIWEYSPQELDVAEAEAKDRDKNDLVELFGPAGAKRYKQLQATANSAYRAPKETAEAFAQVEKMEAGLTEDQRNRLFGIGDTRPQLEDIRDYRKALNGLDYESPEALGRSLRWAVTKVGQSFDPETMNHDQRVALATLRHGFEQAAEQGWDTRTVTNAAIEGAASRFKDPEDAEEMLGHLRNMAKSAGRSAQNKQIEAPSEPITVSERDMPGFKIPSATQNASSVEGVKRVEESTEEPERHPSPLPATVAEIPTSEIHVDPARFQFKMNATGKAGVTDEFKGVTKFDPEKSGIISVWRDPENGRTYVVNGHHRVEMANRLGAPSLTVRYLQADNAAEARLKGALINIAEGKGTAIDAAKIFREKGMRADEVAATGVSLKGQVADQGLALANLNPFIFDKVVSGDIPIERAAIIGRGVKDHGEQTALLKMLDQREKSGRRLTNGQVEELIRLADAGPKKTEKSMSLFGDEEFTRSLLPEKAEVSEYVRRRLGQEKKLFATVATDSAAKQLGTAGNVIKAGENATVAERAQQAGALYDKLSSSAGPVSDALDTAAREIADGNDANAAKERAYDAIRTGLVQQAESLSGAPVQRPAGDGGSRADQTGTGERSAPASEEVTPNETVREARDRTPPSESLFDQGTEAASTEETKRYQDRLLGNQLTAQLKSGMAARPEKLKPAQNKSLFEDNAPEQSSLFSKDKHSTSEVPSGPTAQYRNGILWVNSAAMRAITKIVGGSGAASGLHLQRLPAARLLLSGSLKSARPAIAEAVAAGGPITIVRHDPGQSISKSKELARHEMFHASEKWARDGRGELLLLDQIAQRAAHHLGQMGYDQTDKDLMFSEIGAHLASGPLGWDKMGLSYDQAKELWRRYTYLAKPETLKAIRSIAPQLKEELNAARKLIEETEGTRDQLDSSGGGKLREAQEGDGQRDIRRGVREDLAEARFAREPEQDEIPVDPAVAAEIRTKINALTLDSKDPAPVRNWLEEQVNSLSKPEQAELSEILNGKGDETTQKVWDVHDALKVASEEMGWKPEAILKSILSPKSTPTSEVPERKASRLAEGVEEKAIAERLTQGFEGRPEYEVMNVAEQSKLAAELVRDDLPKAIRIAMGEENPGGKLRPESVFVAVENHAIASKDVNLLRDLAVASTRSMEATEMGQRIRMLAERNPDSPALAMQKVSEARKQAAEKKYGAKAKNQIKVQVKLDIERKLKSPKTWNDWIESIKC